VQLRALSGDVAFLCMLSGIAMGFSATAMSRGLPTSLSAARSASLAVVRLVGLVALMAVGASPRRALRAVHLETSSAPATLKRLQGRHAGNIALKTTHLYSTMSNPPPATDLVTSM